MRSKERRCCLALQRGEHKDAVSIHVKEELHCPIAQSADTVVQHKPLRVTSNRPRLWARPEQMNHHRVSGRVLRKTLLGVLYLIQKLYRCLSHLFILVVL